MPYKNGPNGTKRKYDSSTGKYCRYTDEDMVLMEKAVLRDKVFFKQQAHKQEMENKALKSKDPNLFNVYSYIESSMPNTIKNVNFCVYDKNIKHQREFDLATKDTIIEIKTGTGKHKLKQLLAQKSYAEMHNMKHILYSEDIRYHTKKEYEKNGIMIITNKNDLISFLKERKKRK